MDRDEQRALEDSLELMPRVVRDKLDRVGIKLHLAEWQQLTMAEREQLRDRACLAAADVESYRAELDRMVRARCGKAPDPLLPKSS